MPQANKLLFFTVFFMLFFTTHIVTRVLIMTHAFNRPDFIQYQYKTFKAFLQDDYEFIVFNDANNRVLFEQINAECVKYRLGCITIPQSIHHNGSPSQRHADGINYSLETIGFKHAGIVVIVDSDMFLLKKINITDLMQDYDIVGFPQTRPHGVFYFFPGIVFLNMQKLPDKQKMRWDPGVINGSNADTGAYMHYYLAQNPGIKLYLMNQLAFSNTTGGDNNEILKQYGFDEKAIKFLQRRPERIEFFFNNSFLHYGSVSWAASSNIARKNSLVFDYFNDLLCSRLDSDCQWE